MLTAERQKTEHVMLKLVQDVLDRYGAGIRVDRVRVLKADPPAQVLDAFRDVQAATTDKETLQNHALAYAGRVIREHVVKPRLTCSGPRGYRQQTAAKATHAYALSSGSNPRKPKTGSDLGHQACQPWHHAD